MNRRTFFKRAAQVAAVAAARPDKLISVSPRLFDVPASGLDLSNCGSIANQPVAPPAHDFEAWLKKPIAPLDPAKLGFWLQPTFPAWYRNEQGELVKVDYSETYKKFLELSLQDSPEFKKLKG